MKKIGIIIAMDKELELFAADLENCSEQILHQRRFIEGEISGKKIVVVVSGIGKVNAALCTADLINYFKADTIINIGISGGLDSSLKIGDFVVGDNLAYHDFDTGAEIAQDIPDSFQSSPQLTKLLPDNRHGLLCCGDQFIADESSLKAIKNKFSEALAVDMESAAIAHTCWLHNIPMLSVRQISDTPGIEHHTEQYEYFWKNASNHSVALLTQLLKKL
ncbi:MAG: 5'-methylthioadenosine/adenosylhomocysteine nucleosidase [Alphaproteobacteria bacterium]|nr:5'-methylthioadenosine/adenosylhomocysteine nucleosidase [Alphaproteobacteria bacterium]